MQTQGMVKSPSDGWVSLGTGEMHISLNAGACLISIGVQPTLAQAYGHSLVHVGDTFSAYSTDEKWLLARHDNSLFTVSK
jgi:hypothetical protein